MAQHQWAAFVANFLTDPALGEGGFRSQKPVTPSPLWLGRCPPDAPRGLHLRPPLRRLRRLTPRQQRPGLRVLLRRRRVRRRPRRRRPTAGHRRPRGPHGPRARGLHGQGWTGIPTPKGGGFGLGLEAPHATAMPKVDRAGMALPPRDLFSVMAMVQDAALWAWEWGGAASDTGCQAAGVGNGTCRTGGDGAIWATTGNEGTKGG